MQLLKITYAVIKTVDKYLFCVKYQLKKIKPCDWSFETKVIIKFLVRLHGEYYETFLYLSLPFC